MLGAGRCRVSKPRGGLEVGAKLDAVTDRVLGYRYVFDDFLPRVNGRAWTLRADLPGSVSDKLRPTPGPDSGTSAGRRARR